MRLPCTSTSVRVGVWTMRITTVAQAVQRNTMPGACTNATRPPIGSTCPQLAHSLNMEISGLAGLYCYFLLLCHDWMEDQGLAIWLIPSEVRSRLRLPL